MKLKKNMAEKVLTYKKDPEDERDYKFTSNIEDDVYKKLSKTPSSITHRGKMTSVKDQGYLGSCVGFAVTAMKEWQETTEHNFEVMEGKRDHRQGKQYDLSEAWVYWMSKKIDPWPNEEGTSIRFAMKVLQRLGVPNEGGWEYDDRVKGNPKGWADLVARWSRIGSYFRVRNLGELKVALLDGPVVIGIPCFEEIFSVSRDGFIRYPANPHAIYGGHALCAVGYNDNHKKFGGVLEFKNSWGVGWGNKGYGFLPYEYIDDFLWDAWACKDISVTKEMLKEAKELL